MDAYLDLLIRHIDVHKVLYMLDPNAAQRHHSQQHQHDHGSEHGHGHGQRHTIEFREDMTPLEQYVAEATSRSNLLEMLPELAERIASTYNSIKSKGLADGLLLDEETERQILS